MAIEPTYLPLLRRITNGEHNGELFLSAWAGATPRDDVRQVIATVALREAEHAAAFAKRICELGYHVTVEQAAATADKLAVATSKDLTDREKFEKLGISAPPDTDRPDRWASYFDDSTIDIGTGELLGRFISEERDSVRMLAGCYAALCAEEDDQAPAPTGTDARLDRIERLLATLTAKTSQNGTVTEAEFRAGLRRDGFDDEIRITNYEPDVDGELHTHDFSARVLVLDGEFTLRYQQRSDTFTSGQCCQLDAGTLHAEATGTTGARVLAGLKHPN